MKNKTILLLALLAGLLALLSCHRQRKADSERCESEIDLALGRASLEEVPLTFHALQLLESNRVDDVKVLLTQLTLVNLQNAWAVGQKHGEIADEARSLAREMYPGLKKNIDLGTLARWPKPQFQQITNFMAEVEKYLSEPPR